jgi:hypothetical protein
VEDPLLAVEWGPISGLVVVQTPRVVEAMRDLLAEIEIADHPFNERLEEASPFSFDVDRLPAPAAFPRSC